MQSSKGSCRSSNDNHHGRPVRHRYAGSVVQLRLDGLLMYRRELTRGASNNYKSGKISQDSLYKRILIPGQPDNNMTSDGHPLRAFVHGRTSGSQELQ